MLARGCTKLVTAGIDCFARLLQYEVWTRVPICRIVYFDCNKYYTLCNVTSNLPGTIAKIEHKSHVKDCDNLTSTKYLFYSLPEFILPSQVHLLGSCLLGLIERRPVGRGNYYGFFWPNKEIEGFPGCLISSIPGPPPKQHGHKRLYATYTHPFIRTSWIWKNDYDGQMIFGDIVSLKLPDDYLTGEEKPRKNVTQETCPNRRSNPSPLRDRRACYRLLHRDGHKCNLIFH